jgi:hypothetical protein
MNHFADDTTLYCTLARMLYDRLRKRIGGDVADKALNPFGMALPWEQRSPQVRHWWETLVKDTLTSMGVIGDSVSNLHIHSTPAAEIKKHIDMVTTSLEKAGPLNDGQSLSLPLTPGKTYSIPITLAAGELLSLRTDSPDLYDTILVLIGPSGKPVVGSDDFIDYFAGLDWTASQAGTYHLLVTSFESVSTGELIVSRL